MERNVRDVKPDTNKHLIGHNSLLPEVIKMCRRRFLHF